MNTQNEWAVLVTVISLSLCASTTSHGEVASGLLSRLQAGTPQTIVTYGTSLTAGGAWVAQVRDALNRQYPGLVTVINSGEGSMWSKWGVDNLDSQVISKKPDAVFIEFSINDAYLPYNMTVDQARNNLLTMVDRILASNKSCEIILMVMDPPINEHFKARPRSMPIIRCIAMLQGCVT